MGLDGLPLGLNDSGHGDAAALAHDDHDAALASLVLSLPAVDPVRLPIGRLHMTAEVGAVDFHGVL